MTLGLLGRKVGMTQIFAADGTSVPVTVVAIEPNTVTKIRTPEQDGYTAVQVGIEAGKRRLNKPDLGQFKGEREGFYYSRVSNPTLRQLELTLAELQGRDGCLLTGSGVAAISMPLLALLRSGDHLV